MTTLRSGSATHVGRIRQNNQDSFLIAEDLDLYGVADGMGGHQGGEVASALAVQTVAEQAGTATLEDLKQAVRIANRAIFERAGSDVNLHGMGTTFCAIRVVDAPHDSEGQEVAWVNVGDSRVYLLRDDILTQLSRDHSLVEDLLRDGQITAEEAAVHSQRNILTRALGIDIDVNVDGDSVLPFTGDRFLMCSDGLFNEVTEDQIAAVLRRLVDPREAAEELVRLANEGGGRDNITVVVVEVVDDGGRSAAASRALEASGSLAGTVAVQTPAPAAPADEDHDPWAGRVSSLPDAADDYRAERDDLFGDDLDKASSKRFTWRVAVFALALLAVVGVILGAIWWSARSTYFVGTSGDSVAIYRGKPGGVLIFDPELVESTKLTTDDLTPVQRERLDAGIEKGSLAEARAYAADLRTQVADRKAEENAATTTTAPTTTAPATTAPATTAPPTTSTPAPTTTAGP